MPYIAECTLAGHMSPTGTELAVYGPRGAELRKLYMQTPITPDAKSAEGEPNPMMTATVIKFCSEFRITRVGLAVAGDPSPDGNSIRVTGSLGGWTHFDLRGSIARAAGLQRSQVAIGNSSAGRGLLEAANTDLHPEDQEYFALYLGRGVGGCWVRKTLAGLLYTNPEPGHFPARYGAPMIPCQCGKFNCLEVFASQNAVNRIIGTDPTRRLSSAQLTTMAGDIAATMSRVLGPRPVKQLVIGGLLTASRYYPGLPSEIEAALKVTMGDAAPAVIRSIVRSDRPTAKAGMAFAPELVAA